MPVASHQVNTTNICLNEGWVEQDPEDILVKVKETIAVTCDKLKAMNISPSSIVSLGVTNQRESTVVWDKYTGKPLYNAISKLIVLYLSIFFIFISFEIDNI